MPSSRRSDDLRRGDRVRVTFRDGFNCVGTVERVGTDGHGRRRIIVEDTRGGRRSVSAWRPAIDVERLDGDDRDEGGQSLQDELRAAHRDERRAGGGSA